MKFATKIFSLAVAAGLSLAPAANASITVGNDPTHAGSQIDRCTQCTFVIGQAFGAAGATVSTYSFFTHGDKGDITPVLYTLTGSTFTVSGVGASHSIGAGTAKEYTFDFGLQPGGTAVTTPNTYFGFFNAAGSLVSFDYTTSQTPAYVNGGAYAFQTGTPFVGETFSFSGATQDAYNEQLSRLYSASATATTPEPSSLALLGTGFAGLGGLVRRRFKRA